MRRTLRERIRENILASIGHHTLFEYPTPVNLSYNWNFGSMAIFVLVMQIITGVFLAMFYVPHADYAFESVEYIMREVNYGSLIRYLHSNGATIFFVIVYAHILRGLYYGSYLYPRQLLWTTGVIIQLLMIITAFLGYVLPWGQMSFWGATVITNLVSVVPFIGNDLLWWLWGSFNVDHSTLKKFFSLHFVLPFIILAFALIHIAFLHQNGSGNPLGMEGDFKNKISFSPYYLIKDYLGLFVIVIIYVGLVIANPEYAGHPDNNIKANPMVTPPHIVPEWYFLPYFAILRSIDSKPLGVFLMVMSILILVLVPMLNRPIHRSGQHRPGYIYIFFLQVYSIFALGYIGGCEAVEPYLTSGKIATFLYFYTFMVLIPLQVSYENACYAYTEAKIEYAIECALKNKRASLIAEASKQS
jgi:ubiquinol-cytochrome c reductase cytochrome b subunit